jgi:TRAF-type zinc finger
MARGINKGGGHNGSSNSGDRNQPGRSQQLQGGGGARQTNMNSSMDSDDGSVSDSDVYVSMDMDMQGSAMLVDGFDAMTVGDNNVNACMCPNGCSTMMHRSRRGYHVYTQCPLAMVQCPYASIGCIENCPGQMLRCMVSLHTAEGDPMALQ